MFTTITCERNKVIRIFVKTLLILCCIVVTSGCGFKLRGNYEIPHNLRTIAVVGDKLNESLVTTISSALKRNEVQVFNIDTIDIPLLRISQITLNQSIIAYNANGLAERVNLQLSFNYTLSLNGKLIKPSTAIAVNRAYTINPNTPVGNQTENYIHERELQRKASQIILRQLSKIDLDTSIKTSE